jgi:DNA-directed RNA polymerase specialized sigma24 family protein
VDPSQYTETSDSLSMAFLVLLESLAPAARAVFLLREVFGYRTWHLRRREQGEET